MLHSDRKLTLVFEHCDQDLKKYFDSLNGDIDPDVVKSFMPMHLYLGIIMFCEFCIPPDIYYIRGVPFFTLVALHF